jgi:hypothetical protein
MSRMNLAAVVTAALLGLAAGRATPTATRTTARTRNLRPPSNPLRRGAARRSDGGPAAPDGSLFVPKAVQRQLGLRTCRSPRSAELAATSNSTARSSPTRTPAGGSRPPSPAASRPGPGACRPWGRRSPRGRCWPGCAPWPAASNAATSRRSFAELGGALAIAERKLVRYEQLEGAIPCRNREIEAARFEAGGAEEAPRRRRRQPRQRGAADARRCPA